MTQALLYHQVRKLLLRLDGSRRHVRNWRPQLLLLMALSDGSDGSGGDRGAECLATTLNHVKKSGLLLLAHVVPVLGGRNTHGRAGGGGVTSSPFDGVTPRPGSSFSSRASPAVSSSGKGIGGGGGGGEVIAGPSAWTAAARSVQSRTRDLLDMIDYHGWKAFPAVAMGTSLLSGVQTLVSGGAGLGSLDPATTHRPRGTGSIDDRVQWHSSRSRPAPGLAF